MHADVAFARFHSNDADVEWIAKNFSEPVHTNLLTGIAPKPSRVKFIGKRTERERSGGIQLESHSDERRGFGIWCFWLSAPLVEVPGECLEWIKALLQSAPDAFADFLA